MNNQKFKYEVQIVKDFYYVDYVISSNSRNARKHLKEHNATVVIVYKANTMEVVSVARKTHDGVILVGAAPKK